MAEHTAESDAGMIEIDPNVRVNGNHTFTYLDDQPDLLASLEQGCAYVVYQPEMGMAWPATLVQKDDDGYVEFEVAWAKWKHVTPPGRHCPFCGALAYDGEFCSNCNYEPTSVTPPGEGG